MKLIELGKIGKATYGGISLLLLIVCLFAICIPFSYLRADQKKNVLVLHSYHKGLQWNDRITQGIESVLQDKDQDIELYFEYMDTKRNYDRQYLQHLYELYRHKYRNRRFDVIISSDDHAFRFLLAHHRELFPDTPVVFCGVNDFEDSMLVGRNMITGVVELSDIKSTVDLALELQPNTKQIFVIVDKTLSGTAVKKLVMKTIPYFKGAVKFTFLEDLDMSEVLERVKKLPHDSIVLLIALTTDKSGNAFSLEESCALISRNSAVPVYSHADSYLGHGIVGGMLDSGEAQGKKAGGMALRILHGEKVKDIPVVKKSPNLYEFDYHQMQRFGIKLSILPEGSIVINKPYSFYSKYKRLVWSLIAGIASLVLIILILSFNIIIRRRAEEALRESEEKYRTMIENANDLIWALDTQGIFKVFNRQAEIVSGYKFEDWKGKSFAPLIYQDDLEMVSEVFQKTLSGEQQHYTVRVYKKNGEMLILSVNTAPTYKMGKIDGTVSFGRDITERRQSEEALRRSNEELLKAHNQRKILSKSLIDLLEKDRRQIAMELHDHIGQTLTSLKMSLEIIHGKLKPGHTELGAQITAAKERTIQAIKDVKNVSRGLRPAMIDALGVVSALRELFNDIQQQTNIEIHFFSQGIPKRFKEEKELAIYRIVQEALNNIIRHAQAKNVFVNLVKKDEDFSLSVEDDGVGFDRDEAMKLSKSKGPLGLLIMRERAVQLGGEFTIESQPGKGTHLLVEIPI